jgi:hypothetical protein
MLDGACIIAKVLEVSPDNIVFVPLSESGAPFINSNETTLKRDVLLIEYKNGTIDVYNRPRKNAVYSSDGVPNKLIRKEGEEIPLYNFGSLNTLALCNADISGFFEHLTQNKKLGFGAMAAYNFNQYAILSNAFISVLYNAKKRYDIGVFANIYPSRFKRRNTFSYGVLFKYTAFDFSSVIEEKSASSTQIKYVPSKGSQLATIFTIGIHTKLSKNFFLKTIGGLGGFFMRGEYKQQFNYFANKDNKSTDPEYNYSFLPKLYVGLNIGYNF